MEVYKGGRGFHPSSIKPWKWITSIHKRRWRGTITLLLLRPRKIFFVKNWKHWSVNSKSECSHTLHVRNIWIDNDNHKRIDENRTTSKLGIQIYRARRIHKTFRMPIPDKWCKVNKSIKYVKRDTLNLTSIIV